MNPKKTLQRSGSEVSYYVAYVSLLLFNLITTALLRSNFREKHQLLLGLDLGSPFFFFFVGGFGGLLGVFFFRR